MVRRVKPRLLLSVQLADLDRSYATTRPDSPRLHSQAAPQSLPTLAYHHGFGPWVLGVQSSQSEMRVSYPEPAFDQPAADVIRLFPHRYGGTSLSLFQRNIAAGAALRANNWLGLGASLLLSEVEYTESRRIWAGFAGRDEPLHPRRDLSLGVDMESALTPGGAVGALIAPPALPIEFALALSARARVSLRGSATVEKTQSEEYPAPAGPALASLDLPATGEIRAGARYLGRRFFAEVAATHVLVEESSFPSIDIDGLTIADESSAEASPDALPALLSGRRHTILRAAVEVEALPGLLWFTTGYAFSTPPSGRSRRTPVYGPLGGHTFALGAEATYDRFILTVGYARKLSRRRINPSARTRVQVYAPFDPAVDETISGEVEESSDRVGLAVEVAFQ